MFRGRSDGLTRKVKQEKRTGVVNLPEDDPSEVYDMLHQVYFYRQPNTLPNVPTVDNTKVSFGSNEAHSIIKSATQYSMAVKYDVQMVKENAKRSFAAALKEYSKALAFAEAVTRTIDFSSLAHVIYESTPSNERELRDIFVTFARDNMPHILKNDRHFRDTLHDVEGLGAEIAASIGSNKSTAMIETTSAEAVHPFAPVERERISPFIGRSRSPASARAAAIADRLAYETRRNRSSTRIDLDAGDMTAWPYDIEAAADNDSLLDFD